jgi:hypothetical protein
MYKSHPVVRRAVERVHAAVPAYAIGVHGVLYDADALAARHPGGRLWVELARGTDATELFETSHALGIARARAWLTALPTHGAYAPAERAHRPDDWRLYARLRARVRRHLLGRGVLRARAAAQPRLWLWIALAAGCHLALLTWPTSSRVAAALVVASAAANTVVGAYGHDGVHRLHVSALGLDWNGLSSYEWLLEHVSSHHAYPNTPLDHDAISMMPFVDWDRPRRANLVAYPLFAVAEIAVAIQGTLGHRCRWRARRTPGCPAWMARAPWLFVLRVASHVACQGLRAGVATFLATSALASAYFAYLAHLNHAPRAAPTRCFARWQLRSTADLRPPPWLPPEASLFLDRQRLHHLFPSLPHHLLDDAARRAVGASDAFGSDDASLPRTLHRRLLGVPPAPGKKIDPPEN